MRPDSIEASIRTNPSDLTQWAVYADVLESLGDPRGALMSLMLSQERAPRPSTPELATERERLMATLTPPSLITMAAREKSLAPVFRRGVIFSAGALDGDDFDALVDHPSCAFLQRAIIWPSAATLTEWPRRLEGRNLPWRTLELDTRFLRAEDVLDLGPWLRALPALDRLVVSSPRTIEAVQLGDCPTLRAVSATNASSRFLLGLATHAPALAHLELLGDSLLMRSARDPSRAQSLEELVTSLELLVGRLSSALIEAELGSRLRALLAKERKLIARTLEPSELPNVLPRRLVFEQAFLVVRGEFPAETMAVVTDLAREIGVRQLQVHRASWESLGARLELLRLHGTGEPLLPHQVARVLSQRHRTLDVASIALSNTNTAVQTWSYGPHRRTEKVEQARVRRDESFSFHDRVVRDVVEGLVGFDAGPGLFEALAIALDLSPVQAVFGEGEPTEVFTELVRAPVQDDVDEYDQDEPDGDDEEGDEDEQGFIEEMEEEALTFWGPAPEPPSPFLPDPPRLFGEDDGERVLPGGFADDPALDDEPHFDATNPDLAEVLYEGPVELPEHHQGSTGDPAEDDVPERLVANLCERCKTSAETRRCARCGDEVCRHCAGAGVVAAWEDDKAFGCLECQAPRALFVRPTSD